jgi:hypothetical protein
MSLNRGDIDYISDLDSAARAHLELQHELEQPGLSTGRRTEAKAAMNKLHRVFPDAPKHAATASDDDLGGLSPALKRTRDAHRQRLGVNAQQAANARRRQRSSSVPPRPAQSTRPAPRPRSSSRSPRRGGGVRRGASDFAQFAAPAAVSWGQFAWQAFGWGVGLSLAYLLLTNSERAPRGQSAVELISKGAQHTMAALVNPLTDPLSPRGH